MNAADILEDIVGMRFDQWCREKITYERFIKGYIIASSVKDCDFPLNLYMLLVAERDLLEIDAEESLS